jgi:hypothetical protein
MSETNKRLSVPLSEVEIAERDRAVESAYRRGYVQGYWEGSENERKHGAERVDAFWNDVLSPWRYTDCSQFITPPEIGGEA